MLQARPRSLGRVTLVLAATVSLGVPSWEEEVSPSESPGVDFTFSDAKGLGREAGVCRRDPSDCIRVGDTWYVWYSRVTREAVPPGPAGYPSGYGATVGYATSDDAGRSWTERGEALGKGGPDGFDGRAVFTPNILIWEGKYYLYYTGVRVGFDNGPYTDRNRTAIGVAVAESPAGPWRRLPGPVLESTRDPSLFDSYRVDDACILVREGQVWLYYKGRQWENTPGNTRMGLAVAPRPEGPYVRAHGGQPVQDSGHEVLVWPYGKGCLSLVSRAGPHGRTLQYAPDGIDFRVIASLPRSYPLAPGLNRPDLSESSESADATAGIWGVSMGTYGGDPWLQRFEIRLPEELLRGISEGDASGTTEYAIGADVSFLKQAEDRGTVFKDAGQPKPGLQILKDHGYSWIRLRLFHTPTRLPNDLEYTITTAQEARKLGFKLLLDYHYSDTWADPGHQTMPKAWEGKTHEELVRAVFEYTRDTIAACREAGVLPDMVQVGNEITPGMLWPDGKLPERWKNLADLVKAGIEGIDAGRGSGSRPRVMIHIDKGGNRDATKWFFDHLLAHGVDFDVIGQSYYPWWHGTLDDLRANLEFMAREYPKDIILVEVAYCWRPTEYRTKSGPFPETPEGQRQFLESVDRIVRSTPAGRGAGIFWWEPAVTGHLRSRGFFDDDGNALPVIQVFDEREKAVK